MKIYHTETQADYDALMIELERLGIETLEKRLWKENDNQTVVLVRAIGRYIDNRTDTTFGGLVRTLKNYPRVPITKYKAKVDEKMRFNKQNIERAFDKFMKCGNESFADLKERIINLVDEPEKVVVPKYVADYLKERKRDKDGLFPSLYHFRDNFEEWSIKDWIEEEENIILFTKAWIDGYTIEPEKLYYIPLPDLEMLDGTQQVLSKSKNGNRYFASRPDKNLKQRYTKEELERVPEIYKPFAKPIEEEEE